MPTRTNHTNGWRAMVGHQGDLSGVSELRALFNGVGAVSQKRSVHPDYYRWKLYQNPVWSGVLARAATESGVIVGTATTTPKTLCIGGQRVVGAEIGDTYTHPDYVRQGIFSALVRTACEEALRSGQEFIYGTPNQISRLGYEKKLNFAVIPAAHVRNLVKPLQLSPVLKSLIDSDLAVRLLSPFASTVEAVLRMSRINRRTPDTISIRVTDTFPKEVHDLYRRVSSRYYWILDRDPNYLNWRFTHNPDEYQILLAMEHSKICGYLVTKAGLWNGLEVGYLADFLVEEDCPGAFSALVSWALASFKGRGIAMVAGWAVKGSLYDRVMRHFGFYRHKDVPVICLKNSLGQNVIQNPGAWHFTIADSDNI